MYEIQGHVPDTNHMTVLDFLFHFNYTGTFKLDAHSQLNIVHSTFILRSLPRGIICSDVTEYFFVNDIGIGVVGVDSAGGDIEGVEREGGIEGGEGDGGEAVRTKAMTGNTMKLKAMRMEGVRIKAMRVKAAVK